MSYPPRPPMPPFMNPSIPPPHMLSMTTPPPPVRGFHNSATISSQPTVYHRPPDPMPQYLGPIITVFVGNISERVPETLIKRILATCGTVVNWKRVSTFGFCEYDGPTAGLRAVRLLSETEIDGKKLVAKVDAKNKLLLDKFKKEENENGGGTSESDAEKTDDSYALQQMNDILEEHKHEFDGFDGNNRTDVYGNRTKKPRREEDMKIKTINDNNLEEEKRNLISSEIGKFRKRAEADEHRKELEKEKEKEKLLSKERAREKEKEKEREREREKDKERKKREDKKSKLSTDGEDLVIDAATTDNKDIVASLTVSSSSSTTTPLASSQGRSSSRKEMPMTPSDISPTRKDKNERGVGQPSTETSKDSSSGRRRRSKSRSRERELRDRDIRDKERERERDRDRERIEMRERDRERERERDREREDKTTKTIRDARREKEIEEEMRERKKCEKKARDKEESYQQRLLNWEQREKRKNKENEKYRLKEVMRKEEREKDAKRLKEFVEDYDDERDDVQYYRGRELQRRLAERVREADADSKDRDKEQEELEDLKNKIFSGSYENPAQEYEKARKELEKLYKPNILIDAQQQKQQSATVTTATPDGNSTNENNTSKQNNNSSPEQNEHTNALQHNIKEEPSSHKRTLNKAGSVETISNDEGGSMSNGSDQFNSNAGSNATSNNLNHNQNSRTSSETRDALLDSKQSTQRGSKSIKNKNNNELTNSSERSKVSTPPITIPVISLTLGGNSKKKKIEVTGIFNNDDDADDGSNPKKRKLVPLDYDEGSHLPSISGSRPITPTETTNDRHSSSAVSAASAAAAVVTQKLSSLNSTSSSSTGSGSGNGNNSKGIPSKHSSHRDSSSSNNGSNTTVGGKFIKKEPHSSGSSANAANTTTGASAAGTAAYNPETAGINIKKEENGARVHEEKRRHIKSIIDRIPTQKEELFNYKLDRTEIDNSLMERKIRPWINKKIIEYIGEPEPTLVDFICSKVLAGSSPQSILDDVQMVLDEEAEVFVVKMWRLLIYELDAKKIGLA